MGLLRFVHWVSAFALLATLYGHTLAGVDAQSFTPLAGAAAIGALLAGGLLGLLNPADLQIGGIRRQSAAILAAALSVAWVGFALAHYAERHPSVRDVGLAVLQIGFPFLMLAQRDRSHLLGVLGTACVAMAMADLVWNLGVLAGAWEPVALVGRATEFGHVIRNPGLSGNTLAAGLVALIAAVKLSGDFAVSESNIKKLGMMVSLSFILIDMVLIDSRRYTGEAIIGISVLILPWLRRHAPLPILPIAIASGGLWLTFTSIDPENIQRGALMLQGWEDARRVLLAGQGIYYRPAPTGVNYQSLWAAGVTESGAISLVNSFGLPVTVLFFAMCLLALAGSRSTVGWRAVLLALLTGDFAFSEPLDGFLSAAAFFGCLMFVIFDERCAPPGPRVTVSRLSA